MINQGVVYIELGSTSYTRTIFGQTNTSSVTPLSLLMDLVCRFSGSKLVTKQMSYSGLFLAWHQYAIVTPLQIIG